MGRSICQVCDVCGQQRRASDQRSPGFRKTASRSKSAGTGERARGSERPAASDISAWSATAHFDPGLAGGEPGVVFAVGACRRGEPKNEQRHKHANRGSVIHGPCFCAVEMLVLHAIQCDSGSRDCTGTATGSRQANWNTSKQRRGEFAKYRYRAIS